MSTTVHCLPSDGFSGDITLAVSGLPDGVVSAFTPTSAVNAWTLQLTVDACATSGTATLTIRGSAPGAADATTTLGLTLSTPAEGDKLAILSSVEQECSRLCSQNLTQPQMADAIAAFMKGQPEYVEVGVDPVTQYAWGILQDGRMHIVEASNAPAPSTGFSPTKSIPVPPSGQSPVTRSSESSSNPLGELLPGAAGAVDNVLPASSTARLLQSLGPGFAVQDVIDDMAKWLNDAGWNVCPDNDASLANLRNVKGDGFFFLWAHGGGNDNNRGSSYDHDLYFCVTSSTTHSLILDFTQAVRQDWHDCAIVLMTCRTGTRSLGSDDHQTYYGITWKFVEKYWSFSPNSIVWINACSSFGYTPKNLEFRKQVCKKGAGTYFGWMGTLEDGSEPARYFTDRCLGANKFRPETPFQRPFPADLVYADMLNKGGPLISGANGEALLILPATTPAAELAPSIRLLEVDEFSGTMKLKGAFGADQDTVIVGDAKVQILNWSSTEIKCNLPEDAFGDVQVTVRGLKSNIRPLTRWDVPLEYSWTLKDGVMLWTGFGKLSYRLDVSGFRTKPGEAPTYLRRGTWPMQCSGLSMTPTSERIVFPCVLVGGTVKVTTMPDASKPAYYLMAPLIADPNSHTGVIGLAFAGKTPWAIQCPMGISVPMAPAFLKLQGPEFFFQTQEENVLATVGPLPALAVAYDKSMCLLDLSFPDATAGTLKIQWQGATESSPPRPDNAGC